ncbi:hypothetical protein AY599_18965 [Leptolyngbya valderiana BDU 20041]|nr:hypothetical protein AY599_18965 [Leptolyngbya valderiana BDU 20041]
MSVLFNSTECNTHVRENNSVSCFNTHSSGISYSNSSGIQLRTITYFYGVGNDSDFTGVASSSLFYIAERIPIRENDGVRSFDADGSGIAFTEGAGIQLRPIPHFYSIGSHTHFTSVALCFRSNLTSRIPIGENDGVRGFDANRSRISFSRGA